MERRAERLARAYLNIVYAFPKGLARLFQDTTPVISLIVDGSQGRNAYVY